jgi:hypothetical protein
MSDKDSIFLLQKMFSPGHKIDKLVLKQASVFPRTLSNVAVVKQESICH